MHARTFVIHVMSAAFVALAGLAEAQTTAFVGGRIIDGAGQTIERGTLVVRDGTIEQVGASDTTPVPEGATRVELTGLTVMPGLINAHGHLTNVVGLGADPAGYTRENLIRQLRTYARYGVTTVFSLGDDQPAAFALRDEQSRPGLDRARVYVAGPVIGGASADAARTATDQVVAMRPDLLKMRVDDNLGASRKMPEDAWRAAIARAREVDLPVAVHIYYLDDARAVLEAGASLIAHSIRDKPVDAGFISAMKSRDACYSPTLMREVSTFVYGTTPAWTRDPFFLSGLGERADQIARELENPERQAQIRSSNAYKQGLQHKAGLEIAAKNLKTLADQAVRIAMGTDTGPAGRFQGFFEHLELEMMVDAGLTPMQAIVAATGEAARCHGRAGQLGTLTPGAAADLLVLRSNPLQNITATRSIHSVWIAGRQLEN